VGQWTLSSVERTVAEDSASSRHDGGPSKLDCFIRFDEVRYWLSRTRDLIANAETYSYPAFRESFRELRREARKSEMELVIALFRFERAMNKAMAESKS
jgi:hypothetical protein